MRTQQLSIKTVFYSMQSVYQLIKIFEEELQANPEDPDEKADLQELLLGHDVAFNQLAKLYDELAQDDENFEPSSELFPEYFAQKRN